MKAILCQQPGPPESLILTDLPALVPAKDQVIITVKAAGINFPDTLIIQGKYQFKPTLPFTPGSECAGLVRAIGEDVTRFKPGDAVIAFANIGCFAEEVAVKATDCLPLPAGIDFKQAAAFTLTYGTSWHALKDRARLQAGETVLILGAAGGVGTAAIELAKLLGARVIAAASTDEKLALCKKLGADEVIAYDREDLRERIKALTADAGVDVVYDAVGGKYSEPAVRSLAWKGRYLVIGFAAGDIPKIPLNLLLLKGSSAVGVFWGAFRQKEPQADAANFAELMSWFASGRLRPLVGATYSLAETPRALSEMMQRKITGKAVVVP